jgi:D-3-phosphoglycerate dehydrogenase
MCIRDSSTSALKGALLAMGAEDVTYVNAPALAAERSLTSNVSTDTESPDHRNLVSVRAASADGTQVFVSGTLMGIKQVQKIVAIDKLDLDLKPTNNLLFLRYTDRPGVVGVVGNSLGKLKINIADMQVGRTQEGGQALMALTVDSAIPNDVIKVITKETGASLVRSVNLASE